MAEVPGTLEGWYALHDFRRIDWPRFKTLNRDEQQAVLDEFAAFVSEVEGTTGGSSAIYSVLGHKADLMMIHLRPTVEELNALERRFAATRFADFTSQTYSYLSVTELSLYEATARGGSEDPEQLKQNPFVQKRLYPAIPDYPYACFYPMNKKRGEVNNWYALSMEERRVMMREHGASGRRYHDTITQMITGSTGLDDWEWGVTLFAVDTLPIKKIVYEMRFDEVSAKYGEFGAFQVGIRVKAGKVHEYFSL